MPNKKNESGRGQAPAFVESGFESGRHYYLLDDKGAIVRDADGNAACGEPRSNPDQEFHIATCIGEFAVEYGAYDDDGDPIVEYESPYPVVAIPYKAGDYPGHSGYYIRPDAYHCAVGEVLKEMREREEDGFDSGEPELHIANCHPDYRDIPLIITPAGKKPKYNRPMAGFADIYGGDVARPPILGIR